MIHSALRGLHAFLDTNIFYSDDELRKQVEGLVGKVITTGQEAVEGARQSMRKDLYKKYMTGDPVAGRMPYAIITRLIDCFGWKRLEMNKLFAFSGVTECHFSSRLRRSWVCEFKARFVSKEALSKIQDAQKTHFLRRIQRCKSSSASLKQHWHCEDSHWLHGKCRQSFSRGGKCRRR